MKSDIRVLLVEPDAEHADRVSDAIKQRFPESEVTVVSFVNTAINEIRSHRHDIAVVEYELPDFDGLQFLELLRREDIELPVILVSSIHSERVANEAINFGASDFVVKDQSFHLVLPRVIAEALRRYNLIKKNRELEEQLKAAENLSSLNIAIATLSHEINNPLTTIMGMSELLSKEKALGDSKLRRKLKLINNSAQRIKQSLNRLSEIDKPSLHHTTSGPMIKSSK
jgi:DNA-binding response OmpR family regulator